MSFILDALRKSESERQRDAAPDPTRAPLAPARTKAPVWTWYVIGILALALMAVGAIYWQSVSLTASGRSDAAAAPAGDRPQAGAASPVAGTGGVAPPAVRESAEAVSTAEPAPDSRGDPLPIRELALLDPSLPALTLEFLSYNSEDPARGSAWINGRRYEPGERLEAGPELVEIRPDSVVLAHRGETFLLRSR